LRTKEKKNMANTMTLSKLQRLISKKSKDEIDQFVFGQKIGLITMLFGCWHGNVSRPFVIGKTSYRSCLKCGARKKFNLETLKTDRRFYLPPVTENLHV
jgi:hypothetical protein